MIQKEKSIFITKIAVKVYLIALKAQKYNLVYLADNSRLNNEQIKLLDGLINMIDSMQDYAVDELGFDENDIF